MFDLPSLSHQEQQAAVEKIHALMAKGMSSGEAIKLIAEEIRQQQAQKNQANELAGYTNSHK